MGIAGVVCTGDVIVVSWVMDKHYAYITLSEVEQLLRQHADSLLGKDLCDWSGNWGDGWQDEDEDEDECDD